MTVTPPNPNEATADATACAQPPMPVPPHGRVADPAPAWLNEDLQRRVLQVAQANGESAAAVCEQLVRKGLERFEVHQPAKDPDGSGRCSLRTGVCTLGPVPLPVQQ